MKPGIMCIQCEIRPAESGCRRGLDDFCRPCFTGRAPVEAKPPASPPIPPLTRFQWGTGAPIRPPLPTDPVVSRSGRQMGRPPSEIPVLRPENRWSAGFCVVEGCPHRSFSRHACKTHYDLFFRRNLLHMLPLPRTRTELLSELVRQEPGIDYDSAAARLGWDRNRLRNAMDEARRAGLVEAAAKSSNSPKFGRLFPLYSASEAEPEDRQGPPVFSSPLEAAAK